MCVILTQTLTYIIMCSTVLFKNVFRGSFLIFGSGSLTVTDMCKFCQSYIYDASEECKFAGPLLLNFYF